MDDSDFEDKNNLKVNIANINITNEIKELEKQEAINNTSDRLENKLKPTLFKSFAYSELISKDIVNDIVGNVFHEIVKNKTNAELPDFSFDFSIKMINNLIKSDNIFFDLNHKSEKSANNGLINNKDLKTEKDKNSINLEYFDKNNDIAANMISWEFKEITNKKNKWEYLENPKPSILDFYSSSNIKVVKQSLLKKRMSTIIKNNNDSQLKEDSLVETSDFKINSNSRNLNKDYNSNKDNIKINTDTNLNNNDNKDKDIDKERIVSDSNQRKTLNKKLTINRSTFSNCIYYQADESLKTIEEDEQIVKIRNQKLKEIKLKEEEEKRREAIQQKLKKQAEIELMIKNRQFDSNKLALNFLGEPLNINKVIMTEVNDYKIPKFTFKEPKKEKVINTEIDEFKLKNKILNKKSIDKQNMKIKIKLDTKESKKEKSSKPNTKSINISKNTDKDKEKDKDKGKSSKKLIVVSDSNNNLILGGNNFE